MVIDRRVNRIVNILALTVSKVRSRREKMGHSVVYLNVEVVKGGIFDVKAH